MAIVLPLTKQDLTGRRSGRLVAVEPVAIKHYEGGRNRVIIWRCVCDCGGEAKVMEQSLREGRTKSCGCYQREVPARLSHGEAKKGRVSPEYRAWVNVKKRCFLPSNPDYKNYGGRGITMHPAWAADFSTFLEGVGRRPSPAHTLDRICVNGHYAPSNVRWVTRKIQNNNRRNNRIIEIDGERHTLSEWADIVGLSQDAIGSRLANGWDEVTAVTHPKVFEFGKAKSKRQYAHERHVAKRRATPGWLTADHRRQMRNIRAEARRLGQTVDHIIPLRGRLAWGLHVPWNLQLLTFQENRSKGNRL